MWGAASWELHFILNTSAQLLQELTAVHRIKGPNSLWHAFPISASKLKQNCKWGSGRERRGSTSARGDIPAPSRSQLLLLPPGNLSLAASHLWAFHSALKCTLHQSKAVACFLAGMASMICRRHREPGKRVGGLRALVLGVSATRVSAKESAHPLPLSSVLHTCSPGPWGLISLHVLVPCSFHAMYHAGAWTSLKDTRGSCSVYLDSLHSHVTSWGKGTVALWSQMLQSTLGFLLSLGDRAKGPSSRSTAIYNLTDSPISIPSSPAWGIFLVWGVKGGEEYISTFSLSNPQRSFCQFLSSGQGHSRAQVFGWQKPGMRFWFLPCITSFP